MGKQVHSDEFKRAAVEQGAVVSTTGVGFRSADERADGGRACAARCGERDRFAEGECECLEAAVAADPVADGAGHIRAGNAHAAQSRRGEVTWAVAAVSRTSVRASLARTGALGLTGAGRVGGGGLPVAQRSKQPRTCGSNGQRAARAQ
jgi:hypothetical protein